MSPNVHRQDKRQFQIWMSKEHRRKLEVAASANKAENLTDFILSLIEKAYEEQAKKSEKPNGK